ncbi:hypothetical protein EVAR_60863_1 [Eumeta japonica]|uniref:Uncharacterized protein n=1 Tax=Eumeta variegata TaxID=151549 RepID=A0A4C1Y9T8_EUMVA|nr:hypothetical protein EVAR_60863_1 [Eumeta japonica]
MGTCYQLGLPAVYQLVVLTDSTTTHGVDLGSVGRKLVAKKYKGYRSAGRAARRQCLDLTFDEHRQNVRSESCVCAYKGRGRLVVR